LNKKYFKIPNENKAKFFYQYDCKKLYKTFNTQGQYIFTNYTVKNSTKYFFNNFLFVQLLSQFSSFDLVNLSFLRKFLSHFLIQLTYLNYYFNRVYLNQKNSFFVVYEV
jgi:hypothetical protein